MTTVAETPAFFFVTSTMIARCNRLAFGQRRPDTTAPLEEGSFEREEIACVNRDSVRFRKGALFVALAMLLAVAALPARSEEVVFWYHSDITIHTDASMTVEETIVVRCLNDKIDHGIYRNFPTARRDKYGIRHEAGFQVVTVQRDGRSETYHTEDGLDFVKVYVGREEAVLEPGDYTYVLKYKTDRQLRFFADHDELYWNVTGNDWGFPILEATATVYLPGDVPPKEMVLEAYTGKTGARLNTYQADTEAPGIATFSTTRPLLSGEGLTIVVQFPKGLVHEPSPQEKRAMLLHSNVASLVGLGGLLVVFVYYLIAWLYAGKDPARRCVPARDTPPEDLSPAALRYVHRMGFDHQTFVAAVTSMASKGYLRVEEKKGFFYLKREEEDVDTLSSEEVAIVEAVFDGRDQCKISRGNRTRLRKALEACRLRLAKQCDGVFFVKNRRLAKLGLGVSLAVVPMAAVVSLGPVLVACLGLAGGFWWFVTGGGLKEILLPAWRIVIAGEYKKIPAAIGLTLFFSPFVAVGTAFVCVLFIPMGIHSLFLISGLAVLNLVFLRLLRAYTPQGRILMDQSEAFCQFLEEQRRSTARQSPQDVSRVFAQYLPYAIALGIEKAWSGGFREIIEDAGVSLSDERFAPDWYVGTHWQRQGATGFGRALSTGMAGAVASASVNPVSFSGGSGGGGGGFSGGGGGGGGGGGW